LNPTLVLALRNDFALMRQVFTLCNRHFSLMLPRSYTRESSSKIL